LSFHEFLSSALELDLSIILGIDPGSRITGFGVVRIHSMRSSSLECLGCGVIQLDLTASFPARMKELGESLRQILGKYKPQAVAIEKIFLGKNADSAFKLGHARGVAMYESALTDAEVYEYATRVVKKGIVGRGSATKEEVQAVLEKLLGLRTIRRIDASDALALAVHHAYSVVNQETLRRGGVAPSSAAKKGKLEL
jgi:crossover junction endodeoxyribonuclease RuvC